MTYRVRKQAVTGKLILHQSQPQDLGAAILSGPWRDVVGLMPEKLGEFECVPLGALNEMHKRIAKYDRRANAQREARAEKERLQIARHNLDKGRALMAEINEAKRINEAKQSSGFQIANTGSGDF